MLSATSALPILEVYLYIQDPKSDLRICLQQEVTRLGFWFHFENIRRLEFCLKNIYTKVRICVSLLQINFYGWQR
jgi:hypothetical protein